MRKRANTQPRSTGMFSGSDFRNAGGGRKALPGSSWLERSSVPPPTPAPVPAPTTARTSTTQPKPQPTNTQQTKSQPTTIQPQPQLTTPQQSGSMLGNVAGSLGNFIGSPQGFGMLAGIFRPVTQAVLGIGGFPALASIYGAISGNRNWQQASSATPQIPDFRPQPTPRLQYAPDTLPQSREVRASYRLPLPIQYSDRLAMPPIEKRAQGEGPVDFSHGLGWGRGSTGITPALGWGHGSTGITPALGWGHGSLGNTSGQHNFEIPRWMGNDSYLLPTAKQQYLTNGQAQLQLKPQTEVEPSTADRLLNLGIGVGKTVIDQIGNSLVGDKIVNAYQSAAKNLPWLGEVIREVPKGAGRMASLGTGARNIVAGGKYLINGAPAAFGLDALDLIGLNPFGERKLFSGVMGREEALSRAEALAGKWAPWRVLHGLNSPISTLYEGKELAHAAANEVNAANQEAQRQIQRELASGREPLLNENSEGERLWQQRYGSGVPKAIGNYLLDQIPVTYIVNPNRAYENTVIYQDLLDKARRRYAWNDWARYQKQKLQSQGNQTKLQQLQNRIEQNQPSALDNILVNLHDREFIHPFRREFWTGDWHAPWKRAY